MSFRSSLASRQLKTCNYSLHIPNTLCSIPGLDLKTYRHRSSLFARHLAPNAHSVDALTASPERLRSLSRPVSGVSQFGTYIEALSPEDASLPVTASRNLNLCADQDSYVGDLRATQSPFFDSWYMVATPPQPNEREPGCR